jgi:DNA repair protein RadC
VSPRACTLPVYGVRIVKERVLRYPAPPASTPTDAARLLHAEIGDADREVLVLLLLDAQLKPIGLHRVAVGTLCGVQTTPREIFKAAFLANASRLIVGHVHPSGSVQPSLEDIGFTRTIVEAGKLLGIPVVDHVIVGPEPGVYYSFQEDGALPR